MAAQDTPRTVRAVETTLAVIEVLQTRDGVGVTELAEELGHSKGTIHSHLATLHQKEYVVKDGDQYRLSLRYLDLGETVKNQLTGYSIICEEVDDLAQKTGELAQFATYEHGRAVYLYKSAGKNAVQTASSPGHREYMHRISLGKAILAHLPEETVDEILDRHGMPPSTQHTITDREELKDELATIRERGYAFDEEEKIEGIRCVAAPVRADGGIFGAVSVSGPSTRMVDDHYREELPNTVTRAANVIEINMKFG